MEVMTSLTSPKLARVCNSDNKFYNTEPYYLNDYWSNSLNNFINVYIPKGLIVDGCSIPRLVWRSVGHPLMPRFWVAMNVHDFHYGNTELSEFESNLTRKQVDLLFYDLLRSEGVSKVKASVMYRGVRMGGWTSFRKKSNQYHPFI